METLDKKKDGSLLLISKYGLDCKPYNSECEDVTWETCTIRSWLNNIFYNEAFSDSEKSKIKTTTIVNDDNPEYEDIKGGNNTKDKVFLLSVDEAYQYFINDDGTYDISKDSHARACEATPYAKAQGAYVAYPTQYQGYGGKGNSWWWLRSPGCTQYCAACVINNGSVNLIGPVVDGSNVSSSGGELTVRPSIIIKP